MFQRASCGSKAYRFFAQQIDKIDTKLEALVNSAMAIAMHSFEDLDCEQVWKKINHITQKIKKRVSYSQARANSPKFEINHLNQVFFVEEGYIATPQKNLQNRQASHLLDSFVSTVVELKIGTPELIGLIYAVIAKSIGYSPEPVLEDGLLKIRLKNQDQWMVADFTQAWDRACVVVSDGHAASLSPISNREWLLRMLNRNMAHLQKNNRQNDYAAMEELQALLLAEVSTC